MEKEFVPYQESHELKELGFDEPCFTSYNNNNLVNWWEDAEWVKNSELAKEYITAPTFSQAFRFFREKCGLWQIIYQNTDKDWTYDILPIIGIIDYKLFDVFNTYEEAELACLRKLIEIAKEKEHVNTN
jgi:hypothetical protein